MRLGCRNNHSWLGTLTPFTEAELEEKLFSDRHLRHGEDSKEVLLGQEEQRAWQLWKEKVKQFKKRRQQGAAPIFISEMEVLGQVFNTSM